MTLFYCPSGPLLYYTGGTFGIEDLNPEAKMRWKMSRLELLCIGWRCIWAAIKV